MYICKSKTTPLSYSHCILKSVRALLHCSSDRSSVIQNLEPHHLSLWISITTKHRQLFLHCHYGQYVCNMHWYFLYISVSQLFKVWEQYKQCKSLNTKSTMSKPPLLWLRGCKIKTWRQIDSFSRRNISTVKIISLSPKIICDSAANKRLHLNFGELREHGRYRHTGRK